MATDNHDTLQQDQKDETAKDGQLSRRDFLVGLKKWSKVVVAAALVGGSLGRADNADAGSWINRRGGGGGWANRHHGGGGAWGNRGGSWANGHRGGWANRRGGLGWVNRY